MLKGHNFKLIYVSPTP